MMQALPVEAGGFRGRTNKLVDGCYGWWCGGIWAMLGALLLDDGDTEPDGSTDLFDRGAGSALPQLQRR
jgi:protein farnesyltransferase subunit beta